LAHFLRYCGDNGFILGRRELESPDLTARAAGGEERVMGQIFGIVGSGMLFLSFCAYCEARDALQSATFSFSPGRAKIAGLVAACFTLAVGMVICCLLTMAGTSYEGGL
jgi:hypothetical protein